MGFYYPHLFQFWLNIPSCPYLIGTKILLVFPRLHCPVNSVPVTVFVMKKSDWRVLLVALRKLKHGFVVSSVLLFYDCGSLGV